MSNDHLNINPFEMARRLINLARMANEGVKKNKHKGCNPQNDNTKDEVAGMFDNLSTPSLFGKGGAAYKKEIIQRQLRGL